MNSITSPQEAVLSAEKTWLGMTCAACHTNRIEHNGTVYQIDGAPSMADVQTFVKELAEALDATRRDDAKMQRFARSVGGLKNLAALRDEVAAHSEVLKALVDRNASTHPYGGGLNRMRRAVYEASSQFRHHPKEPAAP